MDRVPTLEEALDAYRSLVRLPKEIRDGGFCTTEDILRYIWRLYAWNITQHGGAAYVRIKTIRMHTEWGESQ